VTGRRALPAHLGQLYREIAKFGAVGAAGVVVNLAAFNVLRRVSDLQTVRASVVATLVAIVCNYVGFRYFAYRDRDKGGRARELTYFLVFSAIGLVIENAVLYAATYGMGWHSDDEKSLGKDTSIASLSFGAERKFALKHRVSKEPVSLILENGSLLVMKGATQTNWLHSLPKSKKITMPRVNLTFRTMV